MRTYLPAQGARRRVPRGPGGTGGARQLPRRRARPADARRRRTYDDLLADRSAFEDFDADAYFNGKGFGFVRLQQLATEHLLGARG